MTAEDMWYEVDSTLGHASYYRQSDGWRELRDERCVALRSDGDRCNRLLSEGAGFCHFHLPRLLDWVAEHHMKRVIGLAQRQQYGPFDYSIETARLNDAMAVLEDASAEVYFIAVGDIVKIGYSRSVLSRFAQLRGRANKTLMPDGYDISQIVLLGSIAGGQAVEAKLHFLLRRFRLEGEWFQQSDAVLATIDHLLYGGNAPDEIETALRLLFERDNTDYFFPEDDDSSAAVA